MSTYPTFWRLDGASTTLLVVQDQAVPRIFWYGSRLVSDTDISSLLAHDDAALPFGTRDDVTPLSLFPQASTAYAASPALSGHRQGTQFAHYFQVIDVQSIEDTLTIQLLLVQPTGTNTYIRLYNHPQNTSPKMCVVNCSRMLLHTGTYTYTRKGDVYQ